MWDEEQIQAAVAHLHACSHASSLVSLITRVFVGTWRPSEASSRGPYAPSRQCSGLSLWNDCVALSPSFNQTRVSLSPVITNQHWPEPRGVFLLSQTSLLVYTVTSNHSHFLNLNPPLDLRFICSCMTHNLHCAFWNALIGVKMRGFDKVEILCFSRI